MTLTTADVAAATHGRLAENDPETARLLEVGLAAARRWCGWHVTPEQEDTKILNGRGGYSLRLPTMRLVSLTSIVEEGVPLDLAYLDVSEDGRVEKLYRYGYDYLGFGDLYPTRQWSIRLGGIEVTMTHGFDTAPEFDAAVLSYIGRAAFTAASVGGLQRTSVGPFSYATPVLEASSAFTGEEQATLSLYKLEPTT